ncbi:MAG TPA: hypothetical protein VHM20_07865 [Gammaproteobacteria bacterium]|jgi:hypothetical protein|nr:hypothetical protein [Gammaproteobacteria bacterium]
MEGYHSENDEIVTCCSFEAKVLSSDYATPKLPGKGVTLYCYFLILILFSLSLGLGLGFGIPLSRTDSTSCLLSDKQVFNETCKKYKTDYTVIPFGFKIPQTVCSPSPDSSCARDTSKGPKYCYGIYTDDLAQYNYLKINETIDCYVYNYQDINVFIEDPRDYAWPKVYAGIAMGILGFLCIVFLFYGLKCCKFCCSSI